MCSRLYLLSFGSLSFYPYLYIFTIVSSPLYPYLYALTFVCLPLGLHFCVHLCVRIFVSSFLCCQLCFLTFVPSSLCHSPLYHSPSCPHINRIVPLFEPISMPASSYRSYFFVSNTFFHGVLPLFVVTNSVIPVPVKGATPTLQSHSTVPLYNLTPIHPKFKDYDTNQQWLPPGMCYGFCASQYF